jgi:hypothetical protein
MITSPGAQPKSAAAPSTTPNRIVGDSFEVGYGYYGIAYATEWSGPSRWSQLRGANARTDG